MVVNVRPVEPQPDLVLAQPADGQRGEGGAPGEQLEPVRLVEQRVVAQRSLEEGGHRRADRVEACGGGLRVGGGGQREALEQLLGRERAPAAQHGTEHGRRQRCQLELKVLVAQEASTHRLERAPPPPEQPRPAARQDGVVHVGGGERRGLGGALVAVVQVEQLALEVVKRQAVERRADLQQRTPAARQLCVILLERVEGRERLVQRRRLGLVGRRPTGNQHRALNQQSDMYDHTSHRSPAIA
mmetsp:Transcript_50447/g.139694  ORF Transcript_50447/g.139694 Transcript_50447/m.139694 type:complete len:243 (+) Transcript_50447:226-954(+)